MFKLEFLSRDDAGKVLQRLDEGRCIILLVKNSLNIFRAIAPLEQIHTKIISNREISILNVINGKAFFWKSIKAR